LPAPNFGRPCKKAWQGVKSESATPFAFPIPAIRLPKPRPRVLPAIAPKPHVLNGAWLLPAGAYLTNSYPAKRQVVPITASSSSTLPGPRFPATRGLRKSSGVDLV